MVRLSFPPTDFQTMVLVSFGDLADSMYFMPITKKALFKEEKQYLIILKYETNFKLASKGKAVTVLK